MTVVWDPTTVIPKLVQKLGYELQLQSMREWRGMKVGAIKEYKLRGKQNNIIVEDGENNTGGFIADGGPTSFSSDAPVEAQYYTKIYRVGVKVGRQAADETKDIDAGIDLTQNAIKKAMRTAGRQQGRAFYGGVLATIATSLGVPTAGATSFNTTDSTPFEPGMKVDVYRGSTYLETVQIDSVAQGALGASRAITIASPGFQNNLADADVMYLQGQYANAYNSMEDVVAPTSDLFGVAYTEKNWKGTVNDFGGGFSKGKLEDLEDERFEASGVDADVILCSKRIEREIYRQDEDKIRFTPGASMDGRGKGKLQVDTMRVERDQQIGNNRLFIHCIDKVRFHVSLPLGPDGARGKNQKPPLIVSETEHVYKVPLSTTANIRPDMRSCEAKGYNFYS
jgi:hypothetical protein